jgi:HlyD family secretion protein
MRKYLLLAIAIVLIGGVAFFFWHRARLAKAAAAAAKEQNTTAVVRRGAIQQSVSSNGQVVSNLDVDIKCRASGEVIKLPFDVSDPVKKGDLLLELDPSDQQRAVHRAEVVVAQSQARLAEAKQNLLVAGQEVVTARQRAEAGITSAQVKAKGAAAKADRRKQLIAEKLASAEDYEQVETEAAQAAADLKTAQVQLEEVKTQELALEAKRQEVALAQAQLEQDQIALADAQQQLSYTKVVAPMDAVVSARDIQIGTIISSGITNIGGGTTILTLSDLSRLFVLASVDESDIGKVAVGQRVLITADAFPTQHFEGKVMRIATKGVTASNVVTFEVKIEVTSANKSLLKPQMTTNVEIISAEAGDALLVPAAAVRRHGGQTTVTVIGADGQQESRPVKIGISDGEQTQILEGVKEGETVLVPREVVSRWTAGQGAAAAPGGQSRGAGAGSSTRPAAGGTR